MWRNTKTYICRSFYVEKLGFSKSQMPYFNKTVFREPVFSLYIKVDKVIDNVLSQIEKKTVQTLIRTLPESNLVWLYTLAV